MSHYKKDYCSCPKPVEVVNSPSVEVKNTPDVKVVNTPDVNVTNTVQVQGCVQTEKKMIPFSPLSVKSQDCAWAGSVPIAEHPCVCHCYDFECNWNDSCGNQDASPNPGVGWSDADPVPGSPPVLGKYMTSDGSDSLKLGLGNINFNPLGFAISLWFKTGNLSQDVRFLAKSVANEVQTHIVSAQLINDKLRFRLKLGDHLDSGTTQWTSGSIIQADTWYHAVYWYDGCEVRVYLNGERQSLTDNGVLEPTSSNNPFDFSLVKGKPVYQGDEPVAIASQPTGGVGGDLGWRAFDGCLDQVIIWKAAINEDLINALYGDGQGATAAPVTVGSNCGDFASQGGNDDFLTCFSQMICVQSCFDVELCKILNECGTVSLEVVNESNVVVHSLVNRCPVGQWPGGFDILESREPNVGKSQEIIVTPQWRDCVSVHTIRLSMDFEKHFGCPLLLNKHSLRFSVHQNSNSVQLPLYPFAITGQRKPSLW
jgi:concanavalin A-like lectin/glucanase superfamily protein